MQRKKRCKLICKLQKGPSKAVRRGASLYLRLAAHSLGKGIQARNLVPLCPPVSELMTPE